MAATKEMKEVVKEIKETKTIYKIICDECGGDYSRRFNSTESESLVKQGSFVCYNCQSNEQDKRIREIFKWLIGATIKDFEVTDGSVAYMTIIDKDQQERHISIGEYGVEEL